MATRFKRVYISDFSIKKVNPQTVQKLLVQGTPIENTIFRVDWDGEYVDFVFDGKNFLPCDGSVRVLNNRSFLRPFNTPELTALARDATKFIVFEPSIDDLNMNKIEIFDTVKVLTFKDYETMVQDLEKEGIVNIVESFNALSVSKKRFRFMKIKDQVKYGTDFYELDSLGGSFLTFISKDIEAMWTQLKDGKAKD